MEKIAKAYGEIIGLMEKTDLTTEEKIILSQTLLSSYQAVQSMKQSAEVMTRMLQKMEKSNSMPTIPDISKLKH